MAVGGGLIAYDPANGRLYVTTGSNLTVIDGSTNRIIGNVAVGGGTYGIAVDSVNGYVVVTNQQPGGVTVIGGSTDRVIAVIPIGHTPAWPA